MSCKYCKKPIGKDFDVLTCANGKRFAKIFIHNRENDTPGIIITETGLALGYFEINFCPKCGEPLTEPKPQETPDETVGLTD